MISFEKVVVVGLRLDHALNMISKNIKFLFLNSHLLFALT